MNTYVHRWKGMMFGLNPLVLTVLLAVSLAAGPALADDRPHVVFLTGDEEYRSEESMPMLAKILQRNYGFRITIGYSLAEDGTIDPNNQHSVSNTEALADADLMVFYLRFRQLPEEQMERFLDYVNSGRPIVGFRTSTHAFLYEDDDHPHHGWHMNGEQIARLVGQHWITHHGHFDDGERPLTEVTIHEEGEGHPVLRGVEPFEAYSWLYHVEGGGDELRGDPKRLLLGRTLRSSHADNHDRFPETNPVAWTRHHEGEHGTGRVFFTTLGHPYDFHDESMRRLSVHGILWALGMEDRIDEAGEDVSFVDEYDPNNSGFGQQFKQGLRPEDVNP